MQRSGPQHQSQKAGTTCGIWLCAFLFFLFNEPHLISDFTEENVADFRVCMLANASLYSYCYETGARFVMFNFDFLNHVYTFVDYNQPIDLTQGGRGGVFQADHPLELPAFVFRKVDVPGDGNCLFHALCFLQDGKRSKMKGKQFRTDVFQYMIDHEELYYKGESQFNDNESRASNDSKRRKKRYKLMYVFFN